MRVLVTRPKEDAAALVEALRARGHEALCEPLLAIRERNDARPDLTGVQALVFTSANGVRAFARASKRRDLPVLAVGPASAAAAGDAGFAKVESADGDTAALAALVRARLDPAAGALYHGAGSRTAGDLAGDLHRAGFDLRREVLYDAVPAEALSDATRRALETGEVAAASFFSPRTAGTFARLVRAAGLEGRLRATIALCLSEAVAEALRDLPWKDVRISVRPTQEALVAALEGLEAAPAAGGRAETEGG